MAGKEDHEGLAYPARGTFDRIFYKIPLVLWRLGFGPYLSSPARGGSKMLVITTTGRKSKLPRHTMASYFSADGKDYVISGWEERSDWVRNFLADPLVTVQAGGRTYPAYASRVTSRDKFESAAASLLNSGGDSHFEKWLDKLDIKMDLGDLIAKRERVYFVGFEPADRQGPSPLRADLVWVWAGLVSLILGLILFFL